MTGRTLSMDSIDFLKTATRRLIRSCGGVESAAMVTRVGKSALSDYQNPTMVDHFMPIDVVVDLERDSGTDHVTQALCRVAGGFFERAGVNTHGALVGLCGHLPGIGQSAGEIMAETAKILADGKISAEERLDLITQLDKCIDYLLAARKSLLGAAE